PAQPGRLAGGAHAPSARRRLAWFVRPHVGDLPEQLARPPNTPQEKRMRLAVLALVAVCASVTLPAAAQQSAPLEYIGKPVRGVPVSQAVKVGKLLFVSGM